EYVAASGEGFAGATTLVGSDRREIELRLPRAEPFEATLVDREGRPVAGAEVRIETIAYGPSNVPEPDGRSSVQIMFNHIRWNVLQGTPLGPAFSATTGDDGGFSLPVMPGGGGLRLSARASDGRVLQVDPGAVA